MARPGWAAIRQSTCRGLCTMTAGPVDAVPIPRKVGWWLAGISGMVFGTVVLGGVTRLTESGLSMTDWKFFGRPPPLTEREWESEFARYKEFPEYAQTHQDMTLAEYKFIFWMEYGHRMWGRCIGAAFLLPAVAMGARGWLSSRWLKGRVAAIGGLIGFQGFLGWYMVKSGLSRDETDPGWVARVSQYRLAAHLGTAFTIYALALEGAFRILSKPLQLVEPFTSAKALGRLGNLKSASIGLVAACFLTAVSGAFVAGMDAGLVYNTFPKFADRWIPSDILALSPVGRNFFENGTTVQFQHRVLGITTASLVGALWMMTVGSPLVRQSKALTEGGWERLARSAGLVTGMAGVQVGLGVATLLWFVPTPLAASHQAGSLTLLSLALWLSFLLRRVPRTAAVREMVNSHKKALI